VAPTINESEILNRLTIVSWQTLAELTKELAAYYCRAISTRDVRAVLAVLEGRGCVSRRPREEAGHCYGAEEYQLTDEGGRLRLRLSATDYDPFASRDR
jgi:hypothetical protein